MSPTVMSLCLNILHRDKALEPLLFEITLHLTLPGSEETDSIPRESVINNFICVSCSFSHSVCKVMNFV